MIDIKNNTVDLDFFKRVLKEIKNNHERSEDIIDSFSQAQFDSKNKLFQAMDSLDIPYKDCNVVIFGSWYGSIIVAGLSDKVKAITAIDLDDETIKIAKNRFFPNFHNIDWITGDVVTLNLSRYRDCNLFINTSCEHMLPMKEWPYWSKLKSDAYFAFQSNNMFQVAGHINCVNSLEEFKSQLPKNSEVLIEEEIDDSRGIRYMLIGKIKNG